MNLALDHAAPWIALPVLALIDSTSVGTLVIPLMLLVTGRGGARRVAGRTLCYLAVIGCFYLVLGIALLSGLLPLYERLQEVVAGTLGLVVLAALGAVLVVWSHASDPATIRRRGGDPERTGAQWAGRARAASSSWRLLVALAVLAGVLEAASMVPYLGAMTIIAHAGWGLPRGAAVLAGYCALMVAPGLALAGTRAALGDRADRVLERLEAWSTRHASSAFSWGVGIIGVLLLVNTLPRLVADIGG